MNDENKDYMNRVFPELNAIDDDDLYLTETGYVTGKEIREKRERNEKLQAAFNRARRK